MGEAGTRAAFARGFWILAPLWLGVVPFGLAYAVTARSAGLSLLQTQALSTFVFAGSAQLSAVGLFAAGAARVEFGTPHGLDSARGIELLGTRTLPLLR